MSPTIWLLWLIIYIVAFAVQTRATVIIVQTNSSTKKAWFLLNKGKARQIMDEVTIETLNFNASALNEVHWEIICQFKYGEPIQMIKFADHSPDEIVRVELAKNRALQDPQLILSMFPLGDSENPSVVKFKGRFLMVCSFAWGVVEGQVADANMRYKWVNHSLYPYYSNEPYLGIHSGHSAFLDGHEKEDWNLFGVDPRVLVLNDDKLHIAYNNNGYGESVMAMGELLVNASGQATIDFKSAQILYETQHHHVEKNWAPFVFNHSVLYVQNMNPFHVVTPVRMDGPNQQYAASFSMTPEWKAPWWIWGAFRGGTNALLVGDVYLAFFHSSTQLPGAFMKTYMMGAYTFSAQPPFRMVSLSLVPIMNDQLYTGEWAQFKNRRIDYVPFPTTFFIENNSIFLSIGHQDRVGYLLTMDLHEVLGSLDPVIHDQAPVHHHPDRKLNDYTN